MMTWATLSNLVAWSLQVGVIVAAGAVLPGILKVHEPAVRYGYWRALLLACFLLPAVQPWQLRVEEPLDAPPQITIDASVSGQATAAVSLPAALSLRARRALTTPVFVVLTAGAFGRLAWLAAGFLRLRRLRRAGRRIDGAGTDLSDLVGTPADVRYVRALRQPVTFGVLRPVILLPESVRSFAPGVRRAVIIHELWHVRRRDWLWVVAEETTRALFWFHPAIGWLVSRVQAAREEVVDELTVLSTNAKRSYLEALLAFADEPSLFPVVPFARRRHLFQRMLLISKEAAMSSRRVAASCAVMAAVVCVSGWYGTAAFPLTAAALPGATGQQMQPRDLRPGEARPASSRESELRAAITQAPSANLYIELAKLQEERGALKDAEATLTEARSVLPSDVGLVMALATFYNRSGRFEETITTLEQAAAMDPTNASRYQVIATFYWEKAYRDPNLSATERAGYVRAGIEATDRALALNPQYAEAMIYKNILLRLQANAESDQTTRAQLIAQADQLRAQAMELQRAKQPSQMTFVPRGAGGAAPPPPPPPPPPVDSQAGARGAAPPPPPPPPSPVDGQAPLRVGGNIKAPTKIKDVRPAYPPDAKAAGIQGVVIIEATIDSAGFVRDTRVLRSIPLLDDAAQDAVRQWEFTPTLMNGQPVPVIMTVTVNFTVQQ